jgi:uncharacterized protein YprB with RNaseH-like and TPR domain
MVDDVLRQRLEALNRGPLPFRVAALAAPSGLRLPAPPSTERVPRSQSATATIRATPGLLRSGDVVVTAAGEHLRIRLPIESFWPGGVQLAAGRIGHLQQLAVMAEQAIDPTLVLQPEFAALVAALPDRVLLLDLETCGLAGAAMFLIGLLRQIDGLPTVELLVARNYAEEHAILETLWQTIAGHEVLVTFNGKSFDWPMVRDRSTRYRLARPRTAAQMLHIDLLHHARRRWRKQLPDCRLQTLEQFICRRRRTDDIPGHRIPAAYAEFVRTGFERDMDAILYHNAVDLVTLFDLTLRLAA